MAEVKYKIDPEAPGPAFDKVIKSLEDAYKSVLQPRPLPLPLPDLDKMDFTRLKDVVANLKALKATVVEGSRQANHLAKVIKNLTWALVGLTGVAVILTAISLYVLFSSAK